MIYSEVIGRGDGEVGEVPRSARRRLGHRFGHKVLMCGSTSVALPVFTLRWDGWADWAVYMKVGQSVVF